MKLRDRTVIYFREFHSSDVQLEHASLGCKAHSWIMRSIWSAAIALFLVAVKGQRVQVCLILIGLAIGSFSWNIPSQVPLRAPHEEIVGITFCGRYPGLLGCFVGVNDEKAELIFTSSSDGIVNQLSDKVRRELWGEANNAL